MKLTTGRKVCFGIIFLLISIVVLLICVQPLAFTKDGLLTREKVEEYDVSFIDYGATRRHDAETDTIYLLHFGFDDIMIRGEEMSREQDVEVEKILPFLYKWEREYGVYRISTGGKKYYFTIVST